MIIRIVGKKVYGYKDDYAHEHPIDFIEQNKKTFQNTIFWKDKQGYRVRKISYAQYELLTLLFTNFNKQYLMDKGADLEVVRSFTNNKTIDVLVRDKILSIKNNRIYLHDRGVMIFNIDEFMENGLRNIKKVKKR